MQCSECNERPATLHLTQFVNGAKKEVHVCEQCAQNKGYIHPQEDAYSLHDLLSGLFNFGSSQINLQTNNFFEKENELECEQCHMTFADFQRIGKFGCASCYDTFKGRLDSIFRKVHSGNTKHQGKIPKREGALLHKQKELAEYRQTLQELIGQEEFEQAAVIRDKIKQIEKREAGDDA